MESTVDYDKLYDIECRDTYKVSFGESKTKILDSCRADPKSTSDLAKILGHSYQTVRKHVQDLEARGCLISSGYLAGKGHMYITDIEGTIKYFFSTDLGRPFARKYPDIYHDRLQPVNPNMEMLLHSLPAVLDTPKHTISNQHTNLWELLIMNGQRDHSPFVRLFYAFTLCVHHIWYLGFLKAQGTREQDLPRPSLSETQAIIKSLGKQIAEHNKILMLMAMDERLYEAGGWETLGSFPVAIAKGESEKLSQFYVNGDINLFGVNYNLQQSFQYAKAVINQELSNKFRSMVSDDPQE